MSKENDKKQKINKSAIKITLIIFLIITIPIVFGIILENKQEKIKKELSGVWYDINGTKISLLGVDRCDVSFNFNSVMKNYPNASNLSKEDIKPYIPITTDCNYKYKNKTISLKFDVKIPATGNTDTFNWVFKSNDDYSELKRIDDKATSDISFTRTKPNNENSYDDSYYEKKAYYKGYYLAGNNSVGKAKIEFSKNNKCIMDFSEFLQTVNMGGGSRMYITYNDGSCTYTTDENEKNFIIHYDGTVDIKIDNTTMSTGTYFVQSDNQEIKISFNDDYSRFELTNGQFEMVNHALFFKGN